MLDPRIGRFFTTDPLEKRYPFQSTYAFAANSPIALIDYLGKGPDDPQTHTVKKGDKLEKISKKYGVTTDDLAKMNDLKDINKLSIGQVLKVNPETNFTTSPYDGGYTNPDNDDFEKVTMNNVLNIGLGFAIGSGKENMVVVGGNALDQIKNWDIIQKFKSEGLNDLKNDKLKPGDVYERSYSPGNIPKFLRSVWEGKEKLISPVHLIGTFNFTMRINADGKSITLALYDSKTIKSLSDGNANETANKRRDNSSPKPFTTQYIRFVWTEDIK